MMDNAQAADMYDVTRWSKEQVADWVYNTGTTGKNYMFYVRKIAYIGNAA